MSKFYDETMKSLQQAAEIAKGTLPVTPVEGLSAETYRTTGILDRELIKKLRERLENVPDAYPDFVEGTIYYARKKPERMRAVMGYQSRLTLWKMLHMTRHVAVGSRKRTRQ